LNPRPIVLAVFALRLSAQAPARDDPAFRVSVNLVQVDAVVTDSKGHPVRGLDRDDFEILEDGKPETITHFSWVDVSPSPAASNPARRATSPATTTLQPVRTTEREDIRRDIVLMVDDVGAASEDQARILSDMRRFVTDQV
jgi:VWFA-related protein